MTFEAATVLACVTIVGLFVFHNHKCAKRNANDQCAKCGRDVPEGQMKYLRLSTRPASGGRMRGFCPECAAKVQRNDKVFWIITIALIVSMVLVIAYLSVGR